MIEKTAVVIAAGLVLAAIAPAAAHRKDLVTPARAGPIRRGETTMNQMRRWFGAPDARVVRRVGCVRVVKASWDQGLRVYASRGDERIVEAVFVQSASVTSSRHGELAMHTRKGLSVGDRKRKLERLYPNAEPMTHAGHSHYRLRTAPSGSYLLAKVVGREVVQLEAWPFEFC